jgi:hypothetical protein
LKKDEKIRINQIEVNLVEAKKLLKNNIKKMMELHRSKVQMQEFLRNLLQGKNLIENLKSKVKKCNQKSKIRAQVKMITIKKVIGHPQALVVIKAKVKLNLNLRKKLEVLLQKLKKPKLKKEVQGDSKVVFLKEKNL